MKDGSRRLTIEWGLDVCRSFEGDDERGEGLANAGDANIDARRKALRIGISLNLEEERFTIFVLRERSEVIKTLGGMKW